MQLITIAVLLTCYNRREKTLQCLQALHLQYVDPKIELKLYLVDDASTDGTAEAVGQLYPLVRVITGTGSLFWNGGMRLAFSIAQVDNPDYYFWINDDTVLYPHALQTLLDVSLKLISRGQDKAVVVGSTLDPETDSPSYGGVSQTHWWHPLKFHHIYPKTEAYRCDTFHGNCVLIPRSVAALVGNLNPAYTHNLGDFDYGLRTRQKGGDVWLAPCYLGTCLANPPRSRMVKTDFSQVKLNPSDRPKGLALEDVTLHSFSEWKAFCRQNGGFLWFFYWLLPYRRLLTLFLFQSWNKSRP
jgi:GT2 family glycosyltransferase